MNKRRRDEIEPEVVNFLMNHKILYDQIRLIAFLESYPSVDHITASNGEELNNNFCDYLNNLVASITESLCLSKVDSDPDPGVSSCIILDLNTKDPEMKNLLINNILADSFLKYFKFVGDEFSRKFGGSFSGDFDDNTIIVTYYFDSD